MVNTRTIMDITIVIISGAALSYNDMNRIKGLTREHYPVTVVVVESNGDTRKFKLRQEDAKDLINEIPKEYRLWH